MKTLLASLAGVVMLASVADARLPHVAPRLSDPIPLSDVPHWDVINGDGVDHNWNVTFIENPGGANPRYSYYTWGYVDGVFTIATTGDIYLVDPGTYWQYSITQSKWSFWEWDGEGYEKTIGEPASKIVPGS